MVNGLTIFYLYMELPSTEYLFMKKVFILLLILLTGNIFPQENTDSLLNQLDTVTGQERIGILKDLCWENRFSHPENALKYGLEALNLLKQFENYEQEASINNYLGII